MATVGKRRSPRFATVRSVPDFRRLHWWSSSIDDTCGQRDDKYIHGDKQTLRADSHGRRDNLMSIGLVHVNQFHVLSGTLLAGFSLSR